MRYMLNILILISFLSCQNRTQTNDLINIDTSIIIEDSNSSNASSKAQLGLPVSLKDLKKLDCLTTTSGVIPKSETSKLCKPDTNGFFGEYVLINKNKNKIIGYLKVYTTDKPEMWRFDSENETFTAIELIGDEIRIWGKITVGTTEIDLEKFIGQNFHYKKGQTIYADFGDYNGTFCINNGKIEKLEIQIVCIDKN
jgi:hypothetical protein